MCIEIDIREVRENDVNENVKNEAKKTNESVENKANEINKIKDCENVDDADKKNKINVNIKDEIKTENVKNCETNFDFFACLFRTCRCNLLLLSK